MAPVLPADMHEALMYCQLKLSRSQNHSKCVQHCMAKCIRQGSPWLGRPFQVGSVNWLSMLMGGFEIAAGCQQRTKCVPHLRHQWRQWPQCFQWCLNNIERNAQWCCLPTLSLHDLTLARCKGNSRTQLHSHVICICIIRSRAPSSRCF